MLAIAAGANAAPSADPGIGEETILLGGTAPLSGASSALAAVARGASAYVAYANARGGVHGRTIAYDVRDDASDPGQADEGTRQLVELEGVFAILDPLGTERNPTTRDYLSARKVPQLFATGFRPSDEVEGWVYGAYLARTRPDARIGVLYQDDLDGRELVAGLMRGLAPASSKLVVTSSHEVFAVDVQSQLAELKASGANVLALFTTPRLARQAYAFASRAGWRPLVVAGSASVSGTAPAAEGAISIAFVKDPADPRWRDDAGVRLYRSIMARYARGANPRDLLHVQGMAVAYETVQLLKAAGKTPTRASVIVRSRRLRDASNPFLLPGITVATSATDRLPVEQAQLQRWSQGRWRGFGGLWRL